jgi:predicted dehydrogenase
MDAVILANNFYQHVPYAVECFKRNIHVFSECTSNGTMGEGVELVRAFEKSKSVYMLAENYPQMIFNREMKRVADGGTLGKIIYAEGEYNHPGDPWNNEFRKMFNYYPKHWRNFLPATYYITHSLGPVMNITGATPKKVAAFATFAPREEDVPSASYNADRAGIIMTQNDDGSVFRVTGCTTFGAEEHSYRVCGTKGQMENLRGMDGKVMLRYNDWEKPEGAAHTQLYMPSWNDKDEELIRKAGHGGGDFFVIRKFFESIRTQTPPELDVFFATRLASVAIMAHKSLLERGVPYDIPDLRLEEDRIKYENDTTSPFWYSDGREPTVRCCLDENYAPSKEQQENVLNAIK